MRTNTKTKENAANSGEVEKLRGALVVATSVAHMLEALRSSDRPGVKEAAEPKAEQAEAEVKLLKSKLRKVNSPNPHN